MSDPRLLVTTAAYSTPGSTVWRAARSSPRLRPGEVHLWRAHLGLDAATLADLSACLSDEERQAASHYRHPEARHHAIASRAILRELLGRYLDRPPSDLVIRRGPLGKPHLEAGDSSLRFNVSHSGGLAVYAFARGREVGIDAQRSVPIEWEELAAAGFLSEGELGQLQALTGERREGAALRCWTRKEAFLKAIGMGLRAPLEEIEVSAAAGRAALLRAPGGWAEAARWSLTDLDLASGYAACLAVEWKVTLSFWEWSPWAR